MKSMAEEARRTGNAAHTAAIRHFQPDASPKKGAEPSCFKNQENSRRASDRLSRLALPLIGFDLILTLCSFDHGQL